MSSYAYEAVDAAGLRMEGTLDVASQSEALRRIKQMGLFPTRVAEKHQRGQLRMVGRPQPISRLGGLSLTLPFRQGRVKSAALTAFTRQLATLVEAGMPLLRGLRILQQQETNRTLRAVIGELSANIESGGSLSEALMAHPKTFNSLYANMVKAGEIGGALETTLRRLAEFMEKAQKIKGKVKSAMFYPVAVLFVASGILILMTVYVIPQFQKVLQDLVPGARMPAFTTFVLSVSQVARRHILEVGVGCVAVAVASAVALRTTAGRWTFDRLKLSLPPIGPVLRKLAISRFARTLGTLLGNGVPILQALTIVKAAVGNVVVGRVIASVHDSVKEGETVAVPLKTSGVFPPVVCGMVDVGEQTGALPDMLLKIADTCDDDVDNAVNAMTALLEPILIIFLAVIVGSIVIALFLPIVVMIGDDPALGSPQPEP